jgi:nicotinate-nucleotide adenylyltransferase
MDNELTRGSGRERLGVLGGSFNPVHLGHLIMAQSALEAFELSRVLLVPCNQPPHKEAARVADSAHRLAMLEHALEGEWRFEVCDIEIQRGGISYTVDTLRALRQRHPESDLYFIIGSDSLRELHQWKDIYTILELCTIVTLCRPGATVDPLSPADLQLRPPHPERLLQNVAVGRMVDISSTDIRYRVAEGMSIRYLVPTGVEMYIAEHSLYR